MKILVIGSTGPQGRQFVTQALSAGHAICAFARNPAALQPAPGLEVLRGDVFDQRSLNAAARGQDAAVSMLGIPLAAARKPTNVFSQGTRNLIAGLKEAGVRRLIFQSSFGVGDSRRDAGLLERVFYALLLRGAYADKVLQEQAVRESGLDYTIVRPRGRRKAAFSLLPKLQTSRLDGYSNVGDDEIGSARLWGKACLRHRPGNR